MWLLSLLLGLVLTPAGARADELISRHDTVRGVITHHETSTGNAYLKIDGTGQHIPLPRGWLYTNVEHTMDLVSESAIVVSYADSQCDARLALIVVTPTTVWGPYALGDCNEMLAYQRSTDGNAFVAIRSDSQQPLAWTYSIRDQEFRGPARASLPPSLAALTSTAGPIPPAAPARTAPSTPQPAPPSSPTRPAPPTQPAFTPAEAGGVAEEVRRTTRAQRRVSIDLT